MFIPNVGRFTGGSQSVPGIEREDEGEGEVATREVFVEQAVIPAPSSAPAPPVVIPRESSGLDVSQSSAIERMIVRTGDMSLVVEDVPVA
jgi:hypothetical protein